MVVNVLNFCIVQHVRLNVQCVHLVTGHVVTHLKSEIHLGIGSIEKLIWSIKKTLVVVQIIII